MDGMPAVMAKPEVPGRVFVEFTDIQAVKVRDGKLDISIPDSPAAAILGLNPDTVIRPSSVREFTAAVLNGMDKNGNFQSGFAVDFAPYQWTAKDLTYKDYKGLARILYNTQLSFATTKGATEEDKSTKLGLGLHVTLRDEGDPRTAAAFLAAFQETVKELGPPNLAAIRTSLPDDGAPVVNRERTDAGRRILAVALARQRLADLQEKLEGQRWNRTRWVVAYAPTFISKDGSSSHFVSNGGAVWTTYAYGFEGTPGLENSSQLIFHLRYRTGEEVPDPLNTGSFFTQDSLLTALQFRLGTDDSNVFLDAAYTSANGGRRGGDALRFGIGLERRINRDFWLNVSIGREVGDTSLNKQTYILGALKFGASSKPIIPSSGQ